MPPNTPKMTPKWFARHLKKLNFEKISDLPSICRMGEGLPKLLSYITRRTGERSGHNPKLNARKKRYKRWSTNVRMSLQWNRPECIVSLKHWTLKNSAQSLHCNKKARMWRRMWWNKTIGACSTNQLQLHKSLNAHLQRKYSKRAGFVETLAINPFQTLFAD